VYIISIVCDSVIDNKEEVIAKITIKEFEYKL